MLHLGVGDAAERAAEVDPDPLTGGRAVLTRPQSRVLQREASRGEAELAETVELAGRLRIHVVERVEVVDLGRDLRSERGWVEAVDAPDR